MLSMVIDPGVTSIKNMGFWWLLIIEAMVEWREDVAIRGKLPLRVIFRVPVVLEELAAVMGLV